MTERRQHTSGDVSSAVTGALLDKIFQLRFPWADEPTSEPDLSSVLAWAGGSPTDAHEQLIQIAWPALRGLTCSDASVDELAAELLAIVEHSPTIHRLRRAVGLVTLLDQCPRMHNTNSTNAIWAARFFDPLAQHIVWTLINDPSGESTLSYESWEPLGLSRLHFWVVTTLVMSAADHSEHIEHHRQLHSIVSHRRQEIKDIAGQDDHFAKQSPDADDILAFSQYMRRPRAERPAVEGLYDYLFERLMIVDLHRPIIEKFGRYPWRNFVLGMENTAAEEEFLDRSEHFGEPREEVKAQLSCHLEDWRSIPFL